MKLKVLGNLVHLHVGHHVGPYVGHLLLLHVDNRVGDHVGHHVGSVDSFQNRAGGGELTTILEKVKKNHPIW